MILVTLVIKIMSNQRNPSQKYVFLFLLYKLNSYVQYT